jgi:thiamine pyrophosphokinase
MNKEKFIRQTEKYQIVTLIGPINEGFQNQKVVNSPLIFVDGGVDLKNQLSKQCEAYPCISLGDGDSKKDPAPLDLSYPREKDQTDLQLALNLVETLPEIQAWGFSGARIDHYLANLGVFYKHSEKFGTKIILDDQILFLPSGRTQFNYSGSFSLITLNPNEITITGEVKYTIKKPTTLTPLSGRGISNHAQGTGIIECSRPIILIPNHKSCSEIKIL